MIFSIQKQFRNDACISASACSLALQHHSSSAITQELLHAQISPALAVLDSPRSGFMILADGWTALSGPGKFLPIKVDTQYLPLLLGQFANGGLLIAHSSSPPFSHITVVFPNGANFEVHDPATGGFRYATAEGLKQAFAGDVALYFP